MRAKLLCCALCALCANLAHAGLINADFETGDLSGWTVTTWPGSVSTIQAEPDGNGGFRAVLRSVATVPNQQARALMEQTFSIVEGSDLSFDYDLDINSGSYGFFFASSVYGRSGAEAGDTLGTRSGTITLRIAPGEYTFYLLATQVPNGDTFDGWLAIDNITLTPVPEPGSLALLFVGLAALTHWGILRSSRASKP